MKNESKNLLEKDKGKLSNLPILKKKAKIPFLKRISFILVLVFAFQSTNEQVFSRYQENRLLEEREFVQSYILSQRQQIAPGELHRLVETVLQESQNLDFGNSIDTLAINKTSFLLAMIQTESQFKKTARSKKKAQGYMQLLHPTAKWMAEKNGIAYEQKKIQEPEINITIGVAYMNYLTKEMGNLEKATLAYNAGPAAVRKWGGVNAYWTTINEHYKAIETLKKTTRPKKTKLQSMVALLD
ncbi:MAG: transglycosylase SLT domain-containing protein [Leptospiraceae bacterium]|nr:transglycosylase SLT domain-containing protein [Leptospiraceae bacterium]